MNKLISTLLFAAVLIPTAVVAGPSQEDVCRQEYERQKATTKHPKALEALEFQYKNCLKAPASSKWEVTTKEDKMSGSKIVFARIKSEETVSFGFPYSGPQHASLMLRTKGKNQPDVLFFIEKGQITDCDVYDCKLVIKIDNGSPFVVRAGRSADGDSTVVFPPKSLAQKIKKAKQVLIQVTIYQQGTHTFTFVTENYPAK